MKSVCHTDLAAPSVSLIKQICYPQVFRFTTAGTRWGCDHEDVARKFYYECMEHNHSDFCCQESGLRIHEEYQFLAATPDGIIECECCGQGVLEIKCPYCIRDDEPDLANFLNDGSLQKGHQHYYQIQTQMFVCNVDYGDFVVCTFKNDVPTMLVERVYVDEDFLVEAIVQAGDFFTVAILPELLGRWYTRKVVMPEATIDDSRTSGYMYCYCKEEQGGEMACCDVENCPSANGFI